MAKKKKSGPLNQIVEVTWTDATSVDHWMPIGAAETEEPVPCKTVGYLINKTKDLLRLAVNRHIDGSQVGIVFLIPTPWITKVRVLK